MIDPSTNPAGPAAPTASLKKSRFAEPKFKTSIGDKSVSRTKIAAYVEPLLLSLFLLAALLISMVFTQALNAQPQATAPPAAAANERYVYCLSGSTGTSVYFSEIFTAVPTSPTSGPHSGRNGFPEFSGPFLSFLQNKYGYKNDSSSPVMCRAIYNVNPAGLSAAQATKKAAEDLAKQASKQTSRCDRLEVCFGRITKRKE